MKRNRNPGLIATLAVAVIVGTMAKQADAQQRSNYTPDFTREIVAVLARELDLDAAQQEAVFARFDEYEEAFRIAAADVRRGFNVMRTTPGDKPEAWEVVIQRAQSKRARALEEWRVEQAILRDEFVGSVLALLDDVQLERWPPLERSLRRDRTLAWGLLGGESMDLIRMVWARDRTTKASPWTSTSVREGTAPPGLRAVLEAYAVDLDTALRARDALPRPFLPGYDPVREIAARRAVRDVNLDYADMIAAELPPERADTFRDAVNEAAFPRVYRRTSAQHRLRVAAAHDDLDESQRAAVLGLETEYLARLADLRITLRDTIRMHDPDQVMRRLDRSRFALEDPSHDGEEDPIRDAFGMRTALDEEIMTRLRSLLTPEQAQAVLGPDPKELPARDERTTIEQQAWVMEEFDADGDGRLDETELDALREYLRTPVDRRDR